MSDRLIVRGAREHNLKDVSLDLPRDAMIVFTGLSGSGKSSLAFDTIFAEGQRRYVESLSAYARQFLGQMDKPDVDFIEGLSPAVSIDQKSTSKNPRSTVGTITEVYDYLRLLFARAGRPHCPECGEPIAKQTPQQIVDRVLELDEGTRFQVLAPVIRGRKGEYLDLFRQLTGQGFCRARVDGETIQLTEPPKLDKQKKHTIDVVVDRLAVKGSAKQRLTDSVETALGLSSGIVTLDFVDLDGEGPAPRAPVLREARLPERPPAGDRRAGAALVLVQLAVRRLPGLLGSRHPDGGRPGAARPGPVEVTRRGRDPAVGRRERLAVLRTSARRARQGPEDQDQYAVRRAAREGEEVAADRARPQVHVSYKNRYGRERSYYTTFEGVIPYVERRHAEASSDTSRDRFEGYMREVPCLACNGARLKPISLAVTMGGKNIAEISAMSIDEVHDFLADMELSPREKQIAERVVKEIGERLQFLLDVGLDYLALNRPAGSLSGGEAQRIRLATQIGSGLVGVLYVLDEPSIGLHQRDNRRLIDTLVRLKDLGNTLIVVEHDEDTIDHADWVVDIGPGAGEHGGQVVVSGTVEDLRNHPDSITGAYISGRKEIPIPAVRRPLTEGRELTVYGAREHNLQDIDVTIPLGVFVAVTGVSGSGKSTLVNDILYTSLARQIYGARTIPGRHTKISGMEQSTRSSTSTSRRSAGPRGPTRRRTRESGTTSASCSRRRPRRRSAGTSRVASRST